ncbi:MAG: hypothetical protein PHC80_04590 [Eubacteriales bacterium]|nr:hypothetical protein [Eubacteriales bacterium]
MQNEADKDRDAFARPVSDEALEDVSGGMCLRSGNTTLEFDPNNDDTQTMLLPGKPGTSRARTLEQKRRAGVPLPKTTHI